MTPTYASDTVAITDWRREEGELLRTDGCVLVLCTEGRAAVSANLRKTVFRRGDLLVLTSDVCFSVERVSPGFAARYVSLSEAAVETSYYRIASQSLWDGLRYAPILRPSAEERRLVEGWMEQAAWIVEHVPEAERVALLDNCIYNFFVGVDVRLAQDARAFPSAPKDRTWGLICRLWSLLMRHAPAERRVEFYAAALHVTPGYLNKVCRRAYGLSPKELIDTQAVVEMKALLRTTGLSVVEIAARLGFDDPSYLCRFFRRRTGCSPLEFRRGAQVRAE